VLQSTIVNLQSTISSNIKSEVDDVSVPDDVAFAFEAGLAGGLDALHVAVGLEVVERDVLGPE